MSKDKSLFLFSQDVGQGRTMLYGVLGENAYWAEKSLTKMLKAGKICEPDNPDTDIVRVDVLTNGTRDTAFKLFGHDEAFEALVTKDGSLPVKK